MSPFFLNLEPCTCPNIKYKIEVLVLGQNLVMHIVKMHYFNILINLLLYIYNYAHRSQTYCQDKQESLNQNFGQ